MSNIDLQLDPVDHITVDAIGKPGNRIFYLQGRKGPDIITLIIEKIQLQSIIIGIKDFLEEIGKQYQNLTDPSPDYEEEKMQITPPVDPLFRVGEMGLAYEESTDKVCIIAKEILGDEKDNPHGEVRYWCSRSQLLSLANWSVVVVARGRPIYPQCQQPMDPEGHFCPKKNGHKKNKPIQS